MQNLKTLKQLILQLDPEYHLFLIIYRQLGANPFSLLMKKNHVPFENSEKLAPMEEVVVEGIELVEVVEATEVIKPGSRRNYIVTSGLLQR